MRNTLSLSSLKSHIGALLICKSTINENMNHVHVPAETIHKQKQ